MHGEGQEILLEVHERDVHDISKQRAQLKQLRPKGAGLTGAPEWIAKLNAPTIEL